MSLLHLFNVDDAHILCECKVGKHSSYILTLGTSSHSKSFRERAPSYGLYRNDLSRYYR